MDDHPIEIECAEPNGKPTTVATTILNAFFDELVKVDDLNEIALNLKKIVIEEGVFAEPAVRAVIFPDAP